MRIIKLIKERLQYPINNDFEIFLDYFEHKTNNKKDEIEIIVPKNYLSRNSKDIKSFKKVLFGKWNLKGTIDLSTLFNPYTKVKFDLLVFSKTENEKIYISKYLGDNTFKLNSDIDLTGEIKFHNFNIHKEFEEYLKDIEEWFSLDEQLNVRNANNFFVSKTKIDFENLTPNYYLPRYMKNLKKLDNEDTLPLSKVAKIITSKKKSVEKNKCIKTTDFNYPFNYDRVKESESTNIKIKKGDILFSSHNLRNNKKLFLVNEELTEDIYLGRSILLIRPTYEKINPYYLFLYLNSDTAMNYFSQNSKGMAIEYLSIQDLKDFPVIIPKSDLLKRCKNIFETLYLKKAAAKVEIINRELFKDTNTFNETKFQKSFLLEQFALFLKSQVNFKNTFVVPVVLCSC